MYKRKPKLKGVLCETIITMARESTLLVTCSFGERQGYGIYGKVFTYYPLRVTSIQNRMNISSDPGEKSEVSAVH